MESSTSNEEQWSETEIASAMAEIEALIDREDLPPWVRRIARAGHERLRDIEAATSANDRARAMANRDSLTNLLPRGLRGVETLGAAFEYIDVDEDKVPVSVTVHWERIPRSLRSETASLAGAYVDFFNPPRQGGRPSRSR
jgi:hypothetical protein